MYVCKAFRTILARVNTFVISDLKKTKTKLLQTRKRSK